MNRFTVDTIKDLSKIYVTIKERITKDGEILETDTMFISFYNKFINDIFDIKKRRTINEL